MGDCEHPPERVVDARRHVHDDGPEATLVVGKIHCLCGAQWRTWQEYERAADPEPTDRERGETDGDA